MPLTHSSTIIPTCTIGTPLRDDRRFGSQIDHLADEKG